MVQMTVIAVDCAAPEVVNETLRQGGKLGYGLAADVWSIGVCTFICLTYVIECGRKLA
jgi:hypothetical protein